MESPKKASVTGIDQIWLINLDRRRDRLDGFMQGHPEMTGRINRLSAYDGKALKLTPALARLFSPNNFHWHKPTMGCALSHLSLWQRLATQPNHQTSFLILEDDARLRATWVSTVEQAFLSGSVPPDWEILFLGGILPQYRESFARNVQAINSTVARVHPNSVFGNNPPGYFHFCAYAYLINARGARRLLDLLHFWNGYWLQADFVAAYHTPDLSPPRRIYFFHPLIAESFQDTAQGLARPYDENQGQENKVDSDIWKNDDRFSPDEIAAIKTDGLPLDIPAALGWAPDDSLSKAAIALRTETESAVQADSSDYTTKKVGLICVTRNSADKLKVTLDSIVGHTNPALFDLYVVDNGSTDITAELCVGPWPPNIHFIRKNENLGWVGGINSCLPQAKKYPFVGFLNDDIEVGPCWLEHLLNLIEWNKTVGAVGPLTSNDRDWQGYDRFRLGPAKPGLPELEGIDRQDVVQMATAMASFNPGVTLNDCVLAFFCVLIRAEIVEKIGPLDEVFNELYLGDDDDYCKRILAAGYLLALSFNAYVAHHSGSRSLAVKDYESRYQKAQQIISEKTAKGAYARKQLANKSASIPHLAAEGDLVPQNLGHMVCEGHLGGFFSEGDGGTYYPLMWAHLVRKHGIRSVLDVGCGRGYSALYFKSLGCHIKGIDGSQEAQATNLLGEDFVLADYAVAPSSIQTEFDLVWSCEFVEHVEERFMKNYLRDFRRGRFLAMTFAGPGQPGHHHVNCRPAEYWIRVMYSQGFDYLPEETAELREYAKKDMEKNDSESDKRFVYHFMYRGLFFKNTGTCSGGL